jgi:ATP-dependent Clp protease ATP-binding subunit ClpC
LCAEVEPLAKSGLDEDFRGQLPQTAHAKEVVEHALEEARSVNDDAVGTEHLLLGLLRTRDGIAAQVLRNLGLKLEDVRQELLRLRAAGVKD